MEHGERRPGRGAYPGLMAEPGTDLERVEPLERVEHLPESLWRSLRAEPHRAPELVALAAADHFAGPAERWAAQMRPHHDPAWIARTALKKHRRLSRLEGAALGLGGITTTAADLAALVWVQSRMVFFIAASYGFEPRHPMRPAELLFLRDVYPTPIAAREALDGVGKLMALQYMESKTTGREDSASLLAELAVMAGRKAAKKTLLKLVPIVASPINAVENGGETAELGWKAIRYYGG
jgi:hypothetical protein